MDLMETMTVSAPSNRPDGEPEGLDIQVDQKSSDRDQKYSYDIHAPPPAPAAGMAAPAAALLQHREALEGMALRLCGNHADAHDLVQDTFERALRMAPAQPPENPGGWLATLMRNVFVDHCRRRSRQPRLVAIAVEDHDPPEPEPEVEPAWASLTRAQVEAALSRLGRRFRRIGELRYLAGASYEEIAAHLGIPISTVGTRLGRARQKMRAMLYEEIQK